jgi:hypothetical protein
MTTRLMPFLAAASVPLLLAAVPASAAVLVSNLDQPVRGTTVVADDLWASQGFTTDSLARTLSSVTLVLGSATAGATLFAELHVADPTGALIASFALPDLSGALAEVTLLPGGPTTLDPGTTYYIVIGATGGSFGWSYAEGNMQSGAGSIADYRYSSDLGASWGPGGFENPYLIEVATEAVPEPGNWALMIAGFGLIGLSLRRQIAIA